MKIILIFIFALSIPLVAGVRMKPLDDMSDKERMKEIRLKLLRDQFVSDMVGSIKDAYRAAKAKKGKLKVSVYRHKIVAEYRKKLVALVIIPEYLRSRVLPSRTK